MKDSLTVEEFNALLREWSGKRVKVEKHEVEDRDEALINLETVSYEKGSSIDDYESQTALQLNGEGLIETTEDNFEKLPSDAFELPLEADAHYEFDGERLVMRTSRGDYVIELLGD